MKWTAEMHTCYKNSCQIPESQISATQKAWGLQISFTLTDHNVLGQSGSQWTMGTAFKEALIHMTQENLMAVKREEK